MGRLYKLKDIYDFLQEYYNLEWRDFMIIRHECAFPIQVNDFNKSCLRVPAVLYKGEQKQICWISVSNTYFNVYGYDENRNKNKSKLWRELLAKQNNQEQTYGI